jgi:hypothetical protein
LIRAKTWERSYDPVLSKNKRNNAAHSYLLSKLSARYATNCTFLMTVVHRIDYAATKQVVLVLSLAAPVMAVSFCIVHNIAEFAKLDRH